MKDIGYFPVVPPKTNHKEPWEYDKELCKQRNVVERLFRRIKEFRKIFTRYDKLDVVYMGFLFCYYMEQIVSTRRSLARQKLGSSVLV
jgi:transposase